MTLAAEPFVAALEAWRATRSPRFAAIAEAAAAKEPERPLVFASGRKADVAGWNALEAEGDWRDLPRLVATIACGLSRVALDRVERLAKRDDPRLVPALLHIVENPPFTSGTSRKFWQAVLGALETSCDERARTAMESLSRRYKTINDTDLGASVAGAMSRAAARMKPARALDAKESAQLVALEIAVFGASGATERQPPAPTRSFDDLFAQIVAAPDDDDPRLVYADLLSESGDERGEFIVLQIERAAGRAPPSRVDLERERFTLTKRPIVWGPPVSTAARSVHFERGFPAVVNLAPTGLAQVADAAEWGTVHTLRHVEMAPVMAMVELLDGGRARNLRDVSILKPALMTRLRTATFPWTKAVFFSMDLEPDHVARLPHLEELTIVGGHLLGPELFAAAPLLTAVTLGTPRPDDGAHLFARNPRLEALVLDGPAEAAGFTGLRIRSLDVTADYEDVPRWLEAIPTVTELRLNITQRRLSWPQMFEVIDAHPTLQKVWFSRYDGIALERRNGSFVLHFSPMSDRPGLQYDLLRSADFLVAQGVTSLSLVPSRPRHEVSPLDPEGFADLRAVWPNMEIRDDP